MDALLGTIRARRDDLIERGNHIAEATRDRGVGALRKVRTNTLDLRRSVASRRAGLADDAPWFRLAGIERRMLEQVEKVLAAFSARMRAEMARLRRFELPANTNAIAPKKRGKKNGNSATPKRLVLPIADYDTLSVREVIAELPRLSDTQRRAVLEFERSHKKRRTLIKALDA